MQGIQSLPINQRRLVFLLLIIGGILAIIAVTVLLISLSLRVERSQAVALVPEATVMQFAALPDDDAYPAALAAAPDGTVYTGSYATGAVWAIAPDGTPRELPDTRLTIGGVSGIAIAPDGSLVILDQGDTDPRTIGGAIWHIAQDGSISTYGAIDDARGFGAPNDIVFDAAGAFYVSDAGRNEVWRFTVDGAGTPQGSVWWTPPPPPADGQNSITGLAYDPLNDAILISDPETNMIYRVAIADRTTEILYQHGERPNPPGFDGLTVGADGAIYVAALGQNGIARVDVANNDLEYIAGLFRGSSDVDAGTNNQLYVTNWDQTSLVLPLIRPSLPFALDIITLDTPTPSAP